VASIASRSAGAGTRANIDEFTQTTARAIERVGHARHGKALIVLNPAEPPLIMRNTVFCLVEGGDRARSKRRSSRWRTTSAYVPGYRLKQAVQFEEISASRPVRLHGVGEFTSGTKVSVFLEIEGAGHYPPKCAGNLDIMTAAAFAPGSGWPRRGRRGRWREGAIDERAPALRPGRDPARRHAR
jgi:acetaldehyde dehydrogenase